MRTLLGNTLLLISLAFTGACTGVPEDIEPVENFDVSRYLGTWYEIARLDHVFEEGLSHVTASYALNDDGSVQVVNRGYAVEEGEWDEAVGTARFVERPELGHLKVSFFGPFYASYVVFALPGDNYQQAYVTGYNRDYLWLLSRTPIVSAAAKADFEARARDLGFDTGELVWVSQDNPPTDKP